MSDIAFEVVKKASCQDIDAFEEIYKTYSGFVYSVSLRITRNSSDAQEITQDVFMKIYHNLKNFQFRSSLKTWIYRIAITTALNYYRKIRKQLRLRVDYDSVIDMVPADSCAAESVIKSDLETELQIALQRLSPEQKTCLILREIEGLSYREISQTLKIPINTVRTRLKRARQALLIKVHKGGEKK